MGGQNRSGPAQQAPAFTHILVSVGHLARKHNLNSTGNKVYPYTKVPPLTITQVIEQHINNSVCMYDPASAGNVAALVGYEQQKVTEAPTPMSMLDTRDDESARLHPTPYQYSQSLWPDSIKSTQAPSKSSKSVIQDLPNKGCMPCIFGKASRALFSTPATTLQSPGLLLDASYTNTARAINPANALSNHYFQLMVDAATRLIRGNPSPASMPRPKQSRTISKNYSNNLERWSNDTFRKRHANSSTRPSKTRFDPKAPSSRPQPPLIRKK